mmetsp:Transcript_53863/g.107219  ORF Transcript_53863/g.107219 Transcript_53863/m.107219 type:complete len:227 (-) Transcript_53863:329-1009(-)
MCISSKMHPHGQHGGRLGRANCASELTILKLHIVWEVPHVLLERIFFYNVNRRRWLRWGNLILVFLRFYVSISRDQRIEWPCITDGALVLTTLDTVQAISCNDPLLGVLLRQVINCSSALHSKILLCFEILFVLPAPHVAFDNQWHSHGTLLTHGTPKTIMTPLNPLLFPAGLQLKDTLVYSCVCRWIPLHCIWKNLQMIQKHVCEVSIICRILHLLTGQLIRSPV